jgi:uncharacterized protein HemX
MDSLYPRRSFYMEDQKMKLSPDQNVQMPMKTVISLIVMVALGTFGFFQIQEKLNQHSTKLEIMGKDLIMNTEFRIKWPRGLLGSLPADSEQFMLIEELYKQTDKVQLRVDSMLHNEVGIKALDKAVDKLQKDVEKLKDKQRQFANGDQ